MPKAQTKDTDISNTTTKGATKAIDISLAASDTPDLGSGDITCRQRKIIYSAGEAVHAVTVVLSGSRACPAILAKNVTLTNGEPPPTPATTDVETSALGSTTYTAFTVNRLVLYCGAHNATGTDECTYRIAQIKESA